MGNRSREVKCLAPCKSGEEINPPVEGQRVNRHQILKERFTTERDFSQYLLMLMPMESQVRFSKSAKHFRGFAAKQRCGMYRSRWGLV